MRLAKSPLIALQEQEAIELAREKAATDDPTLVACQKTHLLIVDDEEMIRQIFKRVLASEFPSLTIDLAVNGLEAMKLFRLGHHGVVLMDLYMPVMNGERAYGEFERLCEKERWVMPSVVFCTGYNASQDIRKIVAVNPKHCVLEKPVKNQVLVDTIRSRLPAAPEPVP